MKAWRKAAENINKLRNEVISHNLRSAKRDHIPVPPTARQQMRARVKVRGGTIWLIQGLLIRAGIINPVQADGAQP